jgi:hypothetical protein
MFLLYCNSECISKIPVTAGIDELIYTREMMTKPRDISVWDHPCDVLRLFEDFERL